MSNHRIAMTTNASPRLASLVERAARATDAKVAEYMRSALVQKLRADGFDVAAALQGQD
jgi:hypothetical protein